MRIFQKLTCWLGFHRAYPGISRDMTEPPDALLSRRSEPDSRAILSDWLEEHGGSVLGRLPRGRRLYAAADAYAYAASASASASAYVDAAAASASASASAYVDAAAASSDADATAYSDADVDATARAAVDADADASAKTQHQNFLDTIKQRNEMKEGLAVTFSTGTYFSVCRIGWLSRVEGDEWQIESARNVRRINSAAIVDLVTCQGDLKKSGHELLAVNPEPEPVHRLHLTRPMPIAKADWPQWVQHFPALKEKLEPIK